MKLVRRDPRIGFLDNWLWLPKSHMSELQVRSALTYPDREGQAIDAWGDEEHHFRVPRNFMSGALGSLRFPIYDARFTAFPRANFQSVITLDAKEPDKDYQSSGSSALLSANDGILCLRCGAGKTVVSLHSAAQLQTPILVVVDERGSPGSG